MDAQQVNHRGATGTETKVRVEGWFTPAQYTWLRYLAKRQDRSMSGVLRQALGEYIATVQQKMDEARRKTGSTTGAVTG